MARRTSLPLAEKNSEPWFKDGLSFQCTQCGNCCTGGPGYVWMSSDEIDRLAAHMNLSRDETLRKYCRTIRGRISLKEKRDAAGQYPCIFLTEESAKDANGRRVTKRGCAIYPVRPLQCRTWPFWDGNLFDEETYAEATQKCPGINRGKAFTAEQIIALRDAEDWPETPLTPSSII